MQTLPSGTSLFSFWLEFNTFRWCSVLQEALMSVVLPCCSFPQPFSALRTKSESLCKLAEVDSIPLLLYSHKRLTRMVHPETVWERVWMAINDIIMQCTGIVKVCFLYPNTASFLNNIQYRIVLQLNFKSLFLRFVLTYCGMSRCFTCSDFLFLPFHSCL